jgi:predicted flap endonuclease-1-like 5' DNA nuclease
MSLLYAVVFASRCRSNHHRLAVDALRHLQSPNASDWQDLLLHYHEDYLAGAKAPDDEFKDFKNHVLHVRDNNWGGAIEACEEWYRRAVSALREKDWKQAAWCAGVMSHYYVDPLQPFHTHQTEEENVIHRAVEWSFSKSYGTFQRILEANGGYPSITVPEGEDWLAQMVLAGAKASNPHYELIIEHYDHAAGVKDPPSGLDDALRETIAGLIGHAAVGLARILDRAFAASAVKPPKVGSTLQGFFLATEMPIQAVLKTISDANARREVEAQYEEFRRTGKVRNTLGEDDKVVRELYANEVLKVPLSSLDAKWPREIGAKSASVAKLPPRPAPLPKPKAAPVAAPAPKPVPVSVEPPPTPRPVVVRPAAHETAAEAPKPAKPAREPKIKPELPEGAPRARVEKNLPRFTLNEDAPVEKAPSIGPKTAKRLEAVGVRTIADLLAASADDKQQQIGARHISAQTIRDWQAQALLACTVPGLKSREAQALVACRVRDAETLAESDAEHLVEGIASWGLSEEGARAWGAAPAPSVDDVATWIERAKRAAKRTVAA